MAFSSATPKNMEGAALCGFRHTLDI